MIHNIPRYKQRKITDRIMRGLTVVATLLALAPLFLILGYVLIRGASSLSVDFFTKTYEPPALSFGGTVQPQGGVLHGIVGTLVIAGAATLLALPVGILAGVFLAEYPSNSVAPAVRFCTDVLSAAPSIVIGVVAYALIVQRTRQFSGLAGSIALATLMVPIITRTTEEILKLAPHATREAAMALGAPKWKVTLTVALPMALGGIVTGVMLAFARAAGETAPLLLTALGSNNLAYDLLRPMMALPLLIYKYTQSPYPAENNYAWSAALVLTLLVLAVNVLVRLATRNKLR